MKKIISLVAILCMMFSLTVCAMNNDATVSYFADKTTVAPNETFSVLVKVSGDTDSNVGMKLGSFTLTYPADLVTLVTDDSKVEDTGLTGASSMNTNTAGKVVVSNRAGADDPYKAGDFTFVTLKFKVNEGATGTINFNTTAMKCTFGVSGGSSYNFTNKTVTLAVNIQAGSTDKNLAEETFTDEQDGTFTNESMTSGDVVIDDNNKITMGENGKIYTYFKKNATEQTLAGGTYGIEVQIGEFKYKFFGKDDVPAGKSWAIKLVAPNGTFEESDKTVSIGDNAVTVFGAN